MITKTLIAAAAVSAIAFGASAPANAKVNVDLYLGGFATNGVNMVKLESYMLNGSFTATQFYADIEGHPDDAPVRRALEELAFFTTQTEILGVYEMHPYRLAARGQLHEA